LQLPVRHFLDAVPPHNRAILLILKHLLIQFGIKFNQFLPNRNRRIFKTIIPKILHLIILK
jgi:hypothetical protein